jgi:hypothetical protein
MMNDRLDSTHSPAPSGCPALYAGKFACGLERQCIVPGFTCRDAGLRYSWGPKALCSSGPCGLGCRRAKVVGREAMARRSNFSPRRPRRGGRRNGDRSEASAVVGAPSVSSCTTKKTRLKLAMFRRRAR